MERTGAIATPHRLATRAGQDIFAKGGTALDAAIAAAAVLTVVYPHNTSIGGDLVALVQTPGGSIDCINATGGTAAAQTADHLRLVHGTTLPERGVDTITVPGAVRGWEWIHARGGRLPWRDLLADAEHHALAGVPVARSVAGAIVAEREHLEQDPGSSRLFLPHGHPREEGDHLRQEALAASLREIADGGADALYKGPLGARLVAGLRSKGSVLDLDDLRAWQPESTPPISAPFEGHRVFTSPPNTQGFALLRTLNALTYRGRSRTGSMSDAWILARLFENGAVLRDRLLSDPRYSSVDLVGYEFDELLAALDAPHARPAPPGLPPIVPGGDTVGIAAADSDGFRVSLIQSLYYSFGAAVLEEGTGIQLQNRGMSFSLDPRSPNVIAPGKRPRHTLMPVMVSRNGEVRWVNSTMGGHAQAQIHAQLLLGVIGGATPLEAVSAPRWVLGPRRVDDPADQVYAEEDVSTATLDSLREDGFPVRSAPVRADWMGHANVIGIDALGEFTAGSDPRADGGSWVGALPER
jgi:gamma-glutamyltranspeptidase/glutathione hydrolase